MSSTLIRTKGLRKHYTVAEQLVRALDGIDISIPKGKTVAIVGESGSGKTTLGNLILGLEEPTEGQIWFRDSSLGCLLYTSPSPRDRTRSRMPSSA